MTARFETKKNRMIIVPNYVWHEVSQYAGDDERLAIVLNCDMAILDNHKSQKN